MRTRALHMLVLMLVLAGFCAGSAGAAADPRTVQFLDSGAAGPFPVPLPPAA